MDECEVIMARVVAGNIKGILSFSHITGISIALNYTNK